MEDLKNHKKLRQNLIDGIVNFRVVEKLGQIMSAVHDATHVEHLSEKEFTDLKLQFVNQPMVDLIRQYIFEDPYDERAETNNINQDVICIAQKMWKNKKVQEAVVEMKQLFLEKKECLLHGDMHTESILVHGDDPKVKFKSYLITYYMLLLLLRRLLMVNSLLLVQQRLMLEC